MSKHRPKDTRLLDPALVGPALRQSVVKLDPRALVRNPVICVTAVVAVVATGLAVAAPFTGAAYGDPATVAQIAAWLWFTVLFANFAEALAEGRGKARADSLRATRTDTPAKKLATLAAEGWDEVSGASLKPGDIVLCETGDVIPADGEVVAGIASVDESAITGESAPVIRESGGDRSAVTGGTRVVSDVIKVKVTQKPGESFLDRMIGLVEGAQRQKTPNEVALTILLVGMSLIFVMVVATLEPFAQYAGATIPVAFLLALLVTLIPTTIGGLLSAIGIAGMDRLVKSNVIAKSGRAVEAAGDVDVLLLDKTGTITYGNRMADELIPLAGVGERELAAAAMLASLADETPEGKSIVDLAKRKYHMSPERARVATFVPFTAQTRMSGCDLTDGTVIRKGAVDAILQHVVAQPEPVAAALPGHAVIVSDGTRQSRLAEQCRREVERVAKAGGTPLVVAENGRLLGVVYLKDIVKPGIRERFAQLRAMGIRTVMVTGDNPLTAAAIAAEAGVDDFLAEATPEKKLELIRKEQQDGRLVAMCGDGSNDAPALAQADIGIAMNDGTPAAREAGNLVDLDSDPAKLIEVVMVGKQLLISRGALTTFSIANDVAKYFAIIPALFVAAYPQLQALNVMGLASPESAILSAVIFNALIIVALIPLALKGVAYRPASAASLLRRNLLVYGLGGLIVPFVGIKAIDLALSGLGLV
ncbi:potassium-transporting ATPase subunit KdpB [Caenispirillum bisanense]|uniref:Potassium-transporting ATPase ATP-binding subunit n=1 Tax=Caenispirillum bisanense TaxID=414052 RepID=A0A286GD03_9PROT|nr:potassium-transporting ATPase subunit KdpB [Caenispirillum bisanense]SOD93368.1 K+-transporting ATPase ATPase B chain [Caenispirillum bisanense]